MGTEQYGWWEAIGIALCYQTYEQAHHMFRRVFRDNKQFFGYVNGKSYAQNILELHESKKSR